MYKTTLESFLKETGGFIPRDSLELTEEEVATIDDWAYDFTDDEDPEIMAETQKEILDTLKRGDKVDWEKYV